MKRHGQNSVGASRNEKIRRQAPRDRYPRSILLVGASVGVVGDYGRRARCGGTPRRVDHLQQLHEVIMNWRNQGLNHEDIGFAAVGVQLHLQAVVAETSDCRRT